MEIQVTIKQVYGNELIYPVCNKAKLFARIKGQKTITPNDIQLIKELGYLIKVTNEVTTL